MEVEKEKQFLAVYDKLADSVFRRCYFKTSDREVAKDLTQDTFFRVWDHLVSGKEVRYMHAFVYTVTNNLIKDYYKKSKSLTIGSLDNFDPHQIADEGYSIEKEAEFEQLLLALDELSEGDRDIVMMRLVDGMSPGEIAEKFGERENTISVRIHRAVKKLRLKVT